MDREAGQDSVLVLDSNGYAGLRVIRSLGASGVPVTAGGASSRTLGMLSRYSDDGYVYPDSEQNPDAFALDLLSHLAESDYFAVVPVTDSTTLQVARYKREIERTGTIAACEDWETFMQAYDKAQLSAVLDTLNVPTPGTYAPKSTLALLEVAGSCEYPAVVKPRSKSHLVDGTYETTLVTDENYVDSPEELIETYRQLVRRYDQFDRQYPLVQEYVPGTTTTTVALADEGEVLTYFQEERLRTYPTSGGNSAMLAAVRDQSMLEYAEEILAHLQWTGPAMVEFMRTPDGEYYVIEVNGRYWGSLPFAIESGVDFPCLHYRQLRGADLSECIDSGDYREDIVQRRLLYEDVKWLHENVSRGNVGALVPFVRDCYRSNHTFVDLGDPAPTLASLVGAAQRAAAIGRSRVTSLFGRADGSRHRASTDRR